MSRITSDQSTVTAPTPVAEVAPAPEPAVTLARTAIDARESMDEVGDALSDVYRSMATPVPSDPVEAEKRTDRIQSHVDTLLTRLVAAGRNLAAIADPGYRGVTIRGDSRANQGDLLRFLGVGDSAAEFRTKIRKDLKNYAPNRR